jgi:hypothetical protein
MKACVREHPKLKWQGISIWPPQWGGSYGPGDKFPRPEEGQLEEVQINEEDYIGPRRLGVTIRFEGRKYSGQMPLDDPEAATRLYEFLKERLGQPLSEIGNEVVDL